MGEERMRRAHNWQFQIVPPATGVARSEGGEPTLVGVCTRCGEIRTGRIEDGARFEVRGTCEPPDRDELKPGFAWG